MTRRFMTILPVDENGPLARRNPSVANQPADIEASMEWKVLARGHGGDSKPLAKISGAGVVVENVCTAV